MQGARRARGSAPLREGGGAAKNGRMMHGKRQTAGAATGGVLRAAVAASMTSHRQETKQSLCGWTMRKPASTATRSTPPAALSIRSEGPIPLAILPPGGTPLSEGGECLRAPHALDTAPIVPTPASQSTTIPEEPTNSVFCLVCRLWTALPASFPGSGRRVWRGEEGKSGASCPWTESPTRRPPACTTPSCEGVSPPAPRYRKRSGIHLSSSSSSFPLAFHLSMAALAADRSEGLSGWTAQAMSCCCKG